MDDKEKLEEAIRLLEIIEKSVGNWGDEIESGYEEKWEKEYVAKGINWLLYEFEQIKKTLEK